MTRIFEIANHYIKHCTWKDLALIKLCLCASGIMLGLSISNKYKKKGLIYSSILFIATYIPLMANFLKFALETKNHTTE